MQALERWAKAKGDKPTTLATFVLRAAIEEAIASGEIPPPVESLPQEEDAFATTDLLTKLIDGKSLTPDEEAAIAEVCDRSPAQVHDVVKRLRERGQ